jgi:hypothetical protein
MIALNRDSVFLYENTAQHDLSVFMPGMTEEENAQLWDYWKRSGLPNYWGSRMNEYWWAFKQLQAWSAGRPIRMIEVGCGASMWPHYVLDTIPGAVVEGVDTGHEGMYDLVPAFKAKVHLCGVVKYQPLENYNVISAISSVEHFDAPAKEAVARLLDGLPPGGLELITTEMWTGPPGVHGGAFRKDDLARTLRLSKEDADWLYEEASRKGLDGKWTVGCFSGIRE